jgi:SAM-dependent methyltransferase
MGSNQEKVFSGGEGDAWFGRNRSRLGAHPLDWPTKLIESIDSRASMRAVGELGCSNGWRLSGLRGMFSPECRFSGMDASGEAIAAGSEAYPGLDLRHGVLSQVPFRSPFDLVIVNFVLHWIDRELLATCVSEIDRLVASGGFLILGDFLPDHPTRRHYHHLPDAAVYTYKQDYARIFTTLGIYEEIDRVIFSHDDFELSSAAGDPAIDPNDRAAVSVLRKRFDIYRES